MSLLVVMVLLQLRPVAAPAVDAGDYLYVSGQGAYAEGESLPSTFEGQSERALSNLKAAIETAGLKLSHVVYTHVYLEDIGKLEAFDSIYARYFPDAPPARAVVGVAKDVPSPCTTRRWPSTAFQTLRAGPVTETSLPKLDPDHFLRVDVQPATAMTSG